MNKQLQTSYKIGDKVVIVRDLRNCISASSRMWHWQGKTMTIKYINMPGNYMKMEEDQWEHDGEGWYWSEEMIDHLNNSFLDDYLID